MTRSKRSANALVRAHLNGRAMDRYMLEAVVGVVCRRLEDGVPMPLDDQIRSDIDSQAGPCEKPDTQQAQASERRTLALFCRWMRPSRVQAEGAHGECRETTDLGPSVIATSIDGKFHSTKNGAVTSHTEFIAQSLIRMYLGRRKLSSIAFRALTWSVARRIDRGEGRSLDVASRRQIDGLCITNGRFAVSDSPSSKAVVGGVPAVFG